MKGLCKLCGNNRPLQNSHIIPRSFYKFIKSHSGQLVRVQEHKEFSHLSNSDPKEFLLCYECEQFLSCEYEISCNNILIDKQKILKSERYNDTFELKGYDYTTYYLFFISILWRAAVSEKYGARGFACLNKFLINSVKNKTIFTMQGDRLDNHVKLLLIKLKDTNEQISQTSLQEIIVDLRIEEPIAEDSDDDATVIYMVLQGFVIAYIIHDPKHPFNHIRFRKRVGILQQSGTTLIPTVDFRELRSIFKAINLIHQRPLKTRAHRIKNKITHNFKSKE
ncbi:hypothetical protein K0I63_18355 [Shewanella rhizosphaerae]|uniref:hypothetical protein n=1 Tax=Shewanella rhizosphaerae TaxID=2864207 RepID=UPI001C6611FC|nr:hypothetical protein [Shewanella rhizosphaerae]QYK12660.1 hypothetical protein K0I63_18355 [Shewanella rhizosphaerae]